jgi:hypothetical protein
MCRVSTRQGLPDQVSEPFVKLLGCMLRSHDAIVGLTHDPICQITQENSTLGLLHICESTGFSMTFFTVVIVGLLAWNGFHTVWNQSSNTT